jgi:hypothetical protein
MKSTLAWIDSQEMPEQWEEMWTELDRLEGDRTSLCSDRFCENCGEVWEYMGSKTLGDTITHWFRHRYHPSTNGRKEIQIVLPHRPAPNI